MNAKKKSLPAFTSLQIVSKRAQELIKQARARSQAPKRDAVADGPIETPADPGLPVSFSLLNIAQATITIIAVIVGAWLIFAVRDTILLLLLSFFVAAIMDPTVALLEKWNVPRGIGVLLHYLVALVIVVFLVVSLVPIIAKQLQDIAVLVSAQADAFIANPRIAIPLLSAEMNARLTELSKSLLENLSINQLALSLRSFGENLASFAGLATRIGLSVVGFIVQVVIVLVLAFFIQLEKEKLRSWIRSFLPMRLRRYLDTKSDAVHSKIGMWARGQLLLGLVIGSLVFIALVILRIPYAATLAVLAGFTEFIPYVGPLIAAVPAVLIAFTQGGLLWAVIIAGVYYAVQWCENNLLVPLIMKRAVGLSPIAIIIAMLLGVSLPSLVHPLLGILLAVPATTIISIFLEDWRQRRIDRPGDWHQR